MTLKEKIAILEAMEKGSTIQYSEADEETDEWRDLTTTELDFDVYTYRVKPEGNPVTKFNVGDKLVYKSDGDLGVIDRYEVTEVGQEYYKLDGILNKPREAAELEFINVRDVLFYFEIYNHVSKKYSMHPTRMTMPEMDKEVGVHYATLSWEPIYSLGFKIKEN
jgi:hypothetical protein